VPSGSCDITGAIAAVGPQRGVGGCGDRQAASPGWSPWRSSRPRSWRPPWTPPRRDQPWSPRV